MAGYKSEFISGYIGRMWIYLRIYVKTYVTQHLYQKKYQDICACQLNSSSGDEAQKGDGNCDKASCRCLRGSCFSLVGPCWMLIVDVFFNSPHKEKKTWDEKIDQRFGMFWVHPNIPVVTYSCLYIVIMIPIPLSHPLSPPWLLGVFDIWYWEGISYIKR